VTRQPLSITPRGVVGTILVLIVAGACVRLGFWQLERRGQRAALNAGLTIRMSEPPVALERVPRDTAGWLYRRVHISGVPDASRAIILPGRLYQGAPGVHVLAPVPLPTGDAVLADFGWAPAADAATVPLDSLDLDTPIDATAIVLPFPGDAPGARRSTLSDRGPGGFRRVSYAMDPDAMRAQFPYELGAIQLQLLPDDDAPPMPVRQAAPALDPGPHLGYAIQWFSFATIAIVGWLVMVAKTSVSRPARAAP
jgi:surfeit locus 1 family protein